MTHDDYMKAAEFWQTKDQNTKQLSDEEIWSAVSEYIAANNTCALATGYGEYVRCTPIEYMFFDDCLWMFSEGGAKFEALENNSNVSVAIFEKYTGPKNLKGLQVMGKANVVDLYSDEYNRAAEKRKIPIAALKKSNNILYLIKVSINDVTFLNKDFEADGAYVRQHLTMTSDE